MTGAGRRPRSPCVGVCRIDRDGALCRGCLRTLDEIARWSAMSDAERDRVMAQLPDRVARSAGNSLP